MSTTDISALERLRLARTKKEKAVGKPIVRYKPVKKGGKGSMKAGRSEKMKGVMAALGPLYEDFLEKRPICEINSPECTQVSEAVHHTAGRGVKQIMNIKSWKACCSACNLYVEKHDEWARENGHKVSRHSKQ